MQIVLVSTSEVSARRGGGSAEKELSKGEQKEIVRNPEKSQEAQEVELESLVRPRALQSNERGKARASYACVPCLQLCYQHSKPTDIKIYGQRGPANWDLELKLNNEKSIYGCKDVWANAIGIKLEPGGPLSTSRLLGNINNITNGVDLPNLTSSLLLGIKTPVRCSINTTAMLLTDLMVSQTQTNRIIVSTVYVDTHLEQDDGEEGRLAGGKGCTSHGQMRQHDGPREPSLRESVKLQADAQNISVHYDELLYVYKILKFVLSQSSKQGDNDLPAAFDHLN
ncbi:hypothetical protein BDV93DRAFT_506188 [Ceratobasidium sp. AG-I]|nr:hypothetical protein BDV93DRAFT_506188 [Ceratobasidium sp. AG-I]